MSLPLAPGRRWTQDPVTGIYIIGNEYDRLQENLGNTVTPRIPPSVSSDVAGGSSHDQLDEEECSSASSSYCEHSNADKLVQLLVNYVAVNDNLLDIKDALRTEKEKVFDGSSRASSSEVSSLTSQSGRLGKNERERELEKEIERLRLQAEERERAHARELQEHWRTVEKLSLENKRELQELRRMVEKLSLENKVSVSLWHRSRARENLSNHLLFPLTGNKRKLLDKHATFPSLRPSYCSP